MNRKPPAEVKTEKIEVRVTERERRMLDALAALRANREFSSLIRQMIRVEFRRSFPGNDLAVTCGAPEPTGAIGDDGGPATCERLSHPAGTMHEGNGLDWYDK